MTVLQATRTKASSGATRSGRLFLLELSGDRIHSMNSEMAPTARPSLLSATFPTASS